MKRTHTCGQLTENNVGKEAVLCGWVHSRRDHGKLIFIDIRDRDGLTQVVFIPKEAPEAHKIAQDLRPEFVISLKGIVNLRPEGTQNPRIKTGMVEVLAKELEILNQAKTPVFEIGDAQEVNEELKLKYRYLDLRKPGSFGNIFMRHRLFSRARNLLEKEGFIEVETPILTKSTPEGARDYLVPSRLNPGSFYALPQSPQLFKQILMVSGFDKYFQIAKCFRDEDLRADRQPEFTQLDIEMSFIDEEDIFALSEKLVKDIVKELRGIDINIPFPRMSHAEAISEFNSDKPDVRKDKDSREELAFVWVTDFPLFKYNDEEKRWEGEHHPFTAPKEEDIDGLEKNKEKARARSYDLVLNGNEIGSGSIRIHNSQLQERIFKIIGMPAEEIEKRFGFLIEAFKYGAPPHGGIAFGLDRFLAILLDQPSIRDVIAFPKTQKGLCLLTDAPSGVDEAQLKALNISISKKIEKEEK
ncbi:MAG: aspartate--tRNA ligase [Candidatus Omnitrophica bacterium]|nr:aspartate--tRNA ligase [Candidatus Omnitrophota bacterium]